MEIPFEIGKTYWLSFVNPQKITVPCPVCNGKKWVTVIDGYDRRWNVDCEGCGLGFERSRGWINEYSYDPGAKQFAVKEISSFYGGKFTLCSTTGDIAGWEALCETEAEAVEASKVAMAQIIEENARRSSHASQNQLKKKAWSVRYHNECIGKLERQIEWHRSKVSHSS